MSKTTILLFPALTEFFNWLKQRCIHEYGSVIVQEIVPNKQGFPSLSCVTYSARMSAKDPERSEIVRCEIQFYHGIWINTEHNRKEAEPAEKEVKEYILKVHKEAFKDYEIKIIPAEFRMGEEKE